MWLDSADLLLSFVGKWTLEAADKYLEFFRNYHHKCIEMNTKLSAYLFYDQFWNATDLQIDFFFL